MWVKSDFEMINLDSVVTIKVFGSRLTFYDNDFNKVYEKTYVLESEAKTAFERVLAKFAHDEILVNI